MKTIITITKSSCPGSYEYSMKSENPKKLICGLHAGNSEEEAAAKAVSVAIDWGRKEGYCIFAPPSVLKHIPENLRINHV
jgi:hypothetical protein